MKRLTKSHDVSRDRDIDGRRSLAVSPPYRAIPARLRPCRRLIQAAYRSTRVVVAGRPHKRCPGCDQTKPLHQFGRHEGRSDQHQVRCRDCRSVELQGSRRAGTLAAYGLTGEMFAALLADQGDRCAICRTDDPGDQWHVDHDHACCPGKRRSCGQCVRGLLCRSCNWGLGHFRDDPDRLRAAAAYLEWPASHRLGVLGRPRDVTGAAP